MSSALTRLFAMVATAGAVSCSPTPSAAPAATAAPAAVPASQQAATPSSDAFSGDIVETMNSGGYTYARIRNGAQDVWIAGPESEATVGESVSVSLQMPMQDFESKTLKRTFPLIYFVQEIGRGGAPAPAATPAMAPPMASAHGAVAAPVQKLPPPPGGASIADVFARKNELSGKSVTVRGQVVKFNGGIMDRNWLHIQDGSGTADAHNNDLTITTDASAAVGDVVTLTGVVGLDRDFGAGYAYDVIIEKASISAR